MKPINVLFVHEFADNIAGQELSLLDRLNGLRDAGIDCTVLLPTEGMFADLLKQRGIKVKFFNLIRLSKKTLSGFLTTILDVKRILKEGKYTIVHCSGAYPAQYAWPASRLLSIPCIVHINSLVYTPKELWKNAIPWVKTIITVSRAVQDAVAKAIPSASAKIVAVHDAVTLKETLNPTAGQLIKERFNIAGHDKVIGQVSSILPLKGIETFIEMAAIVSSTRNDVKFLLIGRVYDQKYFAALKQRIADLNLNERIIFTGFVDDVEQHINIVDVSVLATLSEGLGRVLIQAQLLGKPVIASDIDGCREVIQHKQTGLLVEPGNAKALAEAVHYILDTPNDAKLLVTQALSEAKQRFNVETHVQSLISVYQKAMS